MGPRQLFPSSSPALPGTQEATSLAVPHPAGSTDACLAAGTPRWPHPRHVPHARQQRAGTMLHHGAAWTQAPFSKHPSRCASVIPLRLTHVRPAHPPLLTAGKVGAMSLR